MGESGLFVLELYPTPMSCSSVDVICVSLRKWEQNGYSTG